MNNWELTFAYLASKLAQENILNNTPSHNQILFATFAFFARENEELSNNWKHQNLP
jgi:hypothetical protein